jgi:hypothetical protein
MMAQLSTNRVRKAGYPGIKAQMITDVIIINIEFTHLKNKPIGNKVFFIPFVQEATRIKLFGYRDGVSE